MVSAATDWNFHDPEVQRAVEIYSRHAPFETFEARSKFTKNIKKMERCSVQDALARGYRMGFTAGSDSHQTEHGVEGGIVAAFVPALKREYVWDAIYDRLTYGTTGARILVSLKINSAPHGQRGQGHRRRPRHHRGQRSGHRHRHRGAAAGQSGHPDLGLRGQCLRLHLSLIHISEPTRP